MISLANRDNYINHFRALSSDITANKHLPNSDGVMECTGVKLTNGDELYTFDDGNVYIYDEEHKTWILQ